MINTPEESAKMQQESYDVAQCDTRNLDRAVHRAERKRELQMTIARGISTADLRKRARLTRWVWGLYVATIVIALGVLLVYGATS